MKRGGLVLAVGARFSPPASQKGDALPPTPQARSLFPHEEELLTINGAAFTGSISPRSPDRSSVLLWSLSLSVE